jgi:hypothetical protein
MASTIDQAGGKAKTDIFTDLPPTPEPDSPFRPRQPYRFSTLCATVENPSASHKDQHGSSSVPIYQTATFKGVGGEYDYSRSGNPTRSHLGEYSLADQQEYHFCELERFIQKLMRYLINCFTRTPHSQNLIRYSCVCHLVRYGCSRCHSTHPQAW